MDRPSAASSTSWANTALRATASGTENDDLGEDPLSEYEDAVEDAAEIRELCRTASRHLHKSRMQQSNYDVHLPLVAFLPQPAVPPLSPSKKRSSSSDHSSIEKIDGLGSRRDTATTAGRRSARNLSRRPKSEASSNSGEQQASPDWRHLALTLSDPTVMHSVMTQLNVQLAQLHKQIGDLDTTARLQLRLLQLCTRYLLNNSRRHSLWRTVCSAFRWAVFLAAWPVLVRLGFQYYLRNRAQLNVLRHL